MNAKLWSKSIYLIFAFFMLSYSSDGQQISNDWASQMMTQETSFQEIRDAFYAEWEGKEYEKGKGWKQFHRWENFWETRLMPDGSFPEFGTAFQEYNSYMQNYYAESGTSENSNSAPNGNWTAMGPFSVINTDSWSSGSGRVNVVVEDPNNSSIIYIGAPAGGIWKSTNSGSTWTPLSDDLAVIGVSGIAVNPANSNEIYVTTGDADAGDTYSIGIWKSTNGGTSWSQVNSSTQQFNKILVDPVTTSTVWVAGTSGLYKSTDSGTTWNSLLTGTVKDIALKPGSPSTVYAVGSNQFFYTTNGGTTWSNGAGIPGSGNRLVIGVTPAASNYVYVVRANGSWGYGNVYRSTDSGANFSLRNSTTDIFDGSTQAWYDMALTVSDTDPNTLLFGVLNVWRSTNGGTNWTGINSWSNPSGASYTHADIHYLNYYNGNLYCGSDGGIYKSTNNGTNFTDLTSGLQIGQFYKIGSTPNNVNAITGGLQDNGGYAWHGGSWKNWYGADGMEAAISHTNSNNIFGMTQFGSLYRSTDGGNNNISVGSPQSGNWITPMQWDPNSNRLVAGFQDLYEYNNATNTWSQLSTFGFPGNLSHIEIYEGNSSIMYMASGSNLYKTINNGAAVTTVSNPSGTTITSIEVHPTNSNRLWITGDGWSSGNKIWESTNGGTTWTNLSGGLPNLPTNQVKFDFLHNGLYVGMDIGVYYRSGSSGSFIPFNDQLPNVIVNDIEINEANSKVRIGTYGRGVWESDIYSLGGGSGCTDPAACNYDSTASTSDGSCTYPGCTDATACNYSFFAGCDNGSCYYTCNGCMNPWACNYDSSATIDDGSCTYAGCTDPGACNYDFAATCDNGTCTFDEHGCIATCVDASDNGVDFRFNYWPFSWTQDVGTGDGTITHNNSHIHITGNNAGGANVLTQTTINAATTGTYTFDWHYFTFDGPTYDIGYYINGVRVDLTDTTLGVNQNGSVSFFAFAGDQIGFGVESTDGGFGNGQLLIDNFTWPVNEAGCGCTDPWACNYDSTATIHDLDACSYAYGCTDPGACNFSFSAVCDNGTCEYTTNECFNVCTDATGQGVDFLGFYPSFVWAFDNGSGNGTGTINQGALHVVGNNAGGSNVLTQYSTTIVASGTFTFDWCYFTTDGPVYDIAYFINGVRTDLTDTTLGAIQNGSVSIVATIGDVIAFGIESVDGCCGEGELTITNFTYPIDNSECGCLDPWACNYDSTATNNDNSCTYDFGCTDTDACNYDFAAVCDNGTCVYDIHECLGYCVDPSNNGVGFSSGYWPSSWTQDLGTGDGSISHSNSVIHIVGNNDSFENDVLTQTTITALATGIYSFDWCYYTQDGPFYDIAYYLNGVRVDLTDTTLGDIQNGSVSIFVNAGDIIGFGIDSTDGCCGEGHLTITNFKFPLDTSTCGCADPLACNYDSLIFNHDPLSCEYGGCIDSAACNFNFNAGCDDGSCEYDEDPCFEQCYDPTTGNGVGFRNNYWPSSWTQDFDGGEGAINHTNGYVQIIGNNNTAFNGTTTQTTILAATSGDYSFNWNYFTTDGASFDPAVYINGVETQLSVNADGNSQSGSVTFTATAGDLIGFGVTSTDGCCGEATLVISNFTWPMDTSNCGCTDPWACNYDSAATNYEDGSCDYNTGCMDTTACNYDFEASCDDGTCIYETSECTGYCVDTSGNGVGFNGQYWPFFWTQDIGTGNGTVSHTNGSIHIVGNDNNDNDVLTQTTYSAQVTGTYTFDWCYFGTDGPLFDIAYYLNGVQIDLTDSSLGNLQNGSISFTANAGDVIGFGIESTDGCCGEGHLTINNFTWPVDYTGCGCTDPWASNYDSTATFQNYDDCEYLHGCTDATACNYDATAVVDTGSCVYDSSECTADCIDGIGDGVDFNAYYAPGNWTYNYGTGNGEITQSIGSLHILGNNNSGSLDSGILTEATIVADQTGVYTFDWCYFTTDGPSFDIAYFVNGVRVDLTDSTLGNTQNGSVSFLANAGDVIAFGIDSTDGCCGYGLLTVANFTYPSQECCCPGDANADFIVNVLDLLAVSSNFGCTVGCTDGDADCNGDVTILDLLAVSSNFGAVCP